MPVFCGLWVQKKLLEALITKFLFILILAGCGAQTPSYTDDQEKTPLSEDETVREPVELPRGVRYPIILAHGLLASAKAFSMGNIGINLIAHGHLAFVTEVSAVDVISFRANQLNEQIDKILQETGAEKVNIIGHSMGGLDARYLISMLDNSDRVASLTTIATPHRGSPVADKIIEREESGQELPDFIINFIATVYNEHTDIEQASIIEALKNLSSVFLGEFNSDIVDKEDVYYQSYSGKAEPFKTLRPLLLPSHQAIFALQGDNDGLVSVSSAQWGDYKGEVAADHLDQIGLQAPLGIKDFDSLTLFLRIADDLAARGF